jgi:hypothetical protein
MANSEHVAKLLEGREAWNAWREEDRAISPDLSGAAFDGINLSGFDLTGVNFKGANLTGLRLENTTMISAQLDDAVLSDALLINNTFSSLSARRCCFDDAHFVWTTWLGCDLTAVSFRRTRFLLASFNLCELNEADFSDASLNASFSNTDMHGVRGLDSISKHAILSLGIDTFFRSGGIPDHVLRAANVPEEFITYAASLTGKAIEYYSCFISYSSKDDEFTRRLHADLQARKVRTWFAPEDLKIGDRFHSRIDESIRVHDKLVLILSEHSINSPWVRREVEAALEREDRERRDVLFPIRLDDTIFESKEPWAADLRRSRHIGDFRNWKSHDDYSGALERLVRDLKKEGPIVMS